LENWQSDYLGRQAPFVGGPGLVSSKKLANLKHSVALLVAHFNFCRKHSAHGQTPAMAAGLTDHVWTVAELLASETGKSSQ
jgi:hypothetical protein